MHKVGLHRRLGLRPDQQHDRATKTQDAIVLCHLGIPRIDPQRWSLTIDGMLKTPLSLTLDQLRQRPGINITAVHQCAGSPLEPEIPARRICNVTWTGVPLTSLLRECDVDERATYLWSYGADHGSFEGVEVETYLKDLPLARVADDALIAYELNGKALPMEHGFPARLVVPGFYGTNSVKWLERISLADRRAPSPFTTRWYNDVVLNEGGVPTGEVEPVWRIAPESIVVSPNPDALVPVGVPMEIWGWAWADGGVSNLDVSNDGGQSWQPARLEPVQGRAWQKFTHTWVPKTSGRVSVQSRAKGFDGSMQPPAGRRNAVHSVSILVA
jgi:DMSO/TMAO reductase YedYZ molybdopterin-dependent catalytic subunit